MKPVIVQRPVNVPLGSHMSPHNVAYHPGFPPRGVVVQPQPAYIPPVSYHMPPNVHQPVYSPVRAMPAHNYVPAYQPYYVQAPPMAPYYPQYVVPSMPYLPANNLRPELDFNHNFDYEAANFLTDTKIVQNSVFCVICGHNFKASEKDEHLKKHMRRSDHTSTILFDLPAKTGNQSKVGSKKQYITKPLVQPEQHTIRYEPLVYELVQEVLYEDEVRNPMRDEAIGGDPSIEATNTFVPGNTLNVHVPFLDNNPVFNNNNSTISASNVLNESKVSANQSGSNSLLIEQKSFGQANNSSVRDSQLRKP